MVRRCYILSQKPGCGPREEACTAKITGYLGCWGGLWRQQQGILGAASPLSRPQTSGSPVCHCHLQQGMLNQENRTSFMAQKKLLLKPGKRKSLIFQSSVSAEVQFGREESQALLLASSSPSSEDLLTE